MYTPKPIDTKSITLPEELLALTEKIAENVHDVWAQGRISEGWTYGGAKDLEKKTKEVYHMRKCKIIHIMTASKSDNQWRQTFC